MKNKFIRVLCVFCLAFLFSHNRADAKPLPNRRVKTIHLSDKSVATIWISSNGTVLNFPTKPQKVILGRKKAFDIEYIENDVAVAPLSSSASSNLFVYLQGRRYSFRLYVVPQGGDEIVLVRDSLANRMKVEVK